MEQIKNEQLEQKNNKKVGKEMEQNTQVQLFKRASELTAAERNQLQKVKVQVTKTLTKTKRLMFGIKIKMVDDDKQPLYVDFNTFGKFDLNMFNLMCIENKLNLREPVLVMEGVPIRLFTGKVKDSNTGEVRQYSRYQVFLSNSVIISAFFKFHEIKLIEMMAPNLKFIEIEKEIDFESDASAGF